jgi:hypothetical protein
MPRLCLVTVAICLAAAGARVGAHEIGTTRVSVAFPSPERYVIEIVTDAASLGAKLDTLAPASREDALLRRVVVAFDSTPVRPSVSFAISRPADATTPAIATIRLTGARPGAARTITWSYGWTFSSYALSIEQPGRAAPAVVWLDGSETSAPLVLIDASGGGRWATAVRYLGLGFTHIVPKGLDHVLFVLGIFLLARRTRQVLWQVTAFTIAHSITLALSIYGLVSIPAAIVEPLIALSIAYVAIDNLFLAERQGRRVALVFAFGLLHGLGFAGVLTELGLPRSEFVTALVTFNLGVEAGQLAVIGAAFLLVGWAFSHRAWYRQRIVVPASIAMASIALYWTVERLT